MYILAGISRLLLAHIDTPQRDLHNVYYANLSQRACINKCYIIIQIKCFNLHTFYRPLSRHAECTRSTRGARRVRAASQARTRERAALRERESEREKERALMMAKVAEEPALNSPPQPYRDLHFLRSTIRARGPAFLPSPRGFSFSSSLPLGASPICTSLCTFRASLSNTHLSRAKLTVSYLLYPRASPPLQLRATCLARRTKRELLSRVDIQIDDCWWIGDLRYLSTSSLRDKIMYELIFG